MGLSQSLYSAISGLINHQTRLDSIGNNLANINTVGYKRSITQFADIFSQTLRGGSAPNGNIGGINPSQVGLGMQVASVTEDFSQGAMSATGRTSDLAIQGEGFFKLVNAGLTRYSRDGSFGLGQNGELQNSFGWYVQGWMADANGNIHTGNATGNLLIPLGEQKLARATSAVSYGGNLNASGAVAVANTALVDNNNVLRSDQLFLSDGVTPVTSAAGTQLQDLYANGALLFSGLTGTSTITISAVKGGRNISATVAATPTTTLSTLLTRINNALGIQGGDASTGVTLVPGSGATGGVIRVVGNSGELNEISALTLTPSVGSAQTIFTQTAAANGESTVTTMAAYDSLGNTHMITLTMTLVGQTNTGSTWRWYADCADDSTPDLGVGTGTVTFDQDGQYSTSTNSTISIDLSAQGVTTPLVVTPDFSLLTQFASSGGSEVEARSQDGAPVGALTSFTVGVDGVVSGLFSNGLRQDLGQVCLTRFANNNGLLRDAENLFMTGINSGLPQDGEAMSNGRGSIYSGSLESSNVDIAKEFTDMIMTQRGYQANARTITTSDQMLQELLNVTR